MILKLMSIRFNHFLFNKIIERYHMCDCRLIFPLSPFLSPHRKTLQLNWTGATESPVFPQADFSGNYVSLLAFAGPSRICLFLKLQLTRSSEFRYASYFSWSHRHFPKMQHLSACEVSSVMLWVFLNVPMHVHTLTCKNYCTCSVHTCITAHMHTHTRTQHCFLEAELCCWESAFVAAVECSGLVILHTLGWAGLAWWAVGHRGGGLTNSEMEKRATDVDAGPE